MAIFVDPQQRHYIAIFYGKDGDLYSGSFLRPSNRAVLFLSRIIVPTTTALTLLTIFSVLCFASEMILGPSELYNYIFAAFAGVGCVVAVAYIAVGPLLLHRTKQRLNNVKLQCLKDLSRRMYVLPLVGLLLVGLSVSFMPAFSFASDGLFDVLLLGPIFIGLVFAVSRYSKTEE